MATQIFLTGNQTFVGNPPNDDYIITDNGVGSNTITLGNGTDQLTLGGGGNNTMTVGDGADQITAGGASNTITTGNGDSHVTVGNGSNTITVGTGSNTIALGTGGTGDTVATGAGNNIVSVAGDAVSGDTIMGALTSQDGTTNRLVLTSAGTMSPVNVSGFQTYQLANGGLNSLTLSEGNFERLPGGSISVIGGDSGNTVDAASLSAAHGVVVSGGAGTDHFTGGAGTDRFVFTANSLGLNDTADGGSGNNTVELTAGGTGVLNGLGTSFVNIDTVLLDLNAIWTIAISDPAGFTGTISGFAKGDVIDLIGKTATGLTYAGGILTVQNGGATVATMIVPGQSTAAQFKLTSDGLGGTDVSLTAVNRDFNRDGKADILWRHDNGNVGLWNSNPGSVSFTGQSLGVISTDWTTQTAADFNGDGKADILWRNADGGVALWNSNPGSGSVSFTGQSLGVITPDWTIQAAADFTGDGKADILWRHTNGDVAVWESDPGTASFSGQGLGGITPDWTIQAAADFNGDGKSDILWRYTNGDVAVWDSNPGSVSFSGRSLGVISLDWTIQAAADFNGDGKADILWRNDNGAVRLWDSDPGTNSFTFADLGVISTDWRIEKAADFNGDGKSDILWRNTDGSVAVWDSNPGSVSFSGQSLGVIGTEWHLV